MAPRVLITGCVLAMMSPGTNAQEILYHGGPWESFPIASALRDLDLDYTSERDVDELLVLLRSQPWDLVIVRRFAVYSPDEISSLVPELEAHVDRGGALMFSHARLDLMPEFWPMLGIADASNIFLPLSDIRSPFSDRHPSVAWGGLNVDDELFGPDYGDKVTPAAGGFVLNVYVDTGAPAITMTQDGRVIVNGQEWDNWDAFNGMGMARDQIRWLLSCPADLDGDSQLTVFDFFEFQNRFDSSGASGFADFCYDGRLDVFDFLEFLNLFEAGC